MKLKIIQTKEAIQTVDPNERFVHIAFRPSLKDILELMKRTPELCFVQIAKSYNKTISKSLIDIFEMKKITLVEGDVWGFRTDINEYLVVPTGVIMDLSESGKSIKAISLETRINEPIIKYVLKN